MGAWHCSYILGGAAARNVSIQRSSSFCLMSQSERS